MSETQAAPGRDVDGIDDPAWEELPLDPAPSRVARRPRPVWLLAAAGVLLLNGVGLSLYLGFLAAAPPWAPDPLPAVGAVMGLAALVAAAGVFRQAEWGRWLGIALVIGWLARDAVLVQAGLETGFRGLDGTAPSLFIDAVLPIGVNLVVLFLLVRRWPTRDDGRRRASN